MVLVRLASLVAAVVTTTTIASGDAFPLFFSRQLDASGSDDPGDLSATNFTSHLLHHVNLVRANGGVAPLCLNAKLTVAAQRHADDMAEHDFVRNVGSDESSLMDRLIDEGFNYTAIGETIAAGHASARRVVDAWQRSPWHNTILVSEDYTFFGGGYAFNADTKHHHYWVQDFAGAHDGEACDPLPQDPVTE